MFMRNTVRNINKELRLKAHGIFSRPFAYMEISNHWKAVVIVHFTLV